MEILGRISVLLRSDVMRGESYIQVYLHGPKSIPSLLSKPLSLNLNFRTSCGKYIMSSCFWQPFRYYEMCTFCFPFLCYTSHIPSAFPHGVWALYHGLSFLLSPKAFWFICVFLKVCCSKLERYYRLSENRKLEKHHIKTRVTCGERKFYSKWHLWT